MYRSGSFTFLGLDIEGFERPDRGECVQIGLRASLYDGLLAALESLGLSQETDLLDRGDGVIALLPARFDARHTLTKVIPPLMQRIDEYNLTSSGPSVMRLRIVIHAGKAIGDGRGYIGPDIRLVFRLLDSDTLRRRLHHATETAVLAVTEAVWNEFAGYVSSDDEMPRFEGSLSFETKETREQAWVTALGNNVLVQLG